MSINWHIDQKVVCIANFPNVIDGRVCKSPLKINGVYTVFLYIENLAINGVLIGKKGLVIKDHNELHNTVEVAIYDAEGFMPFDLYIANSKAVDKLMEEIL